MAEIGDASEPPGDRQHGRHLGEGQGEKHHHDPAYDPGNERRRAGLLGHQMGREEPARVEHPAQRNEG